MQPELWEILVVVVVFFDARQSSTAMRLVCVKSPHPLTGALSGVPFLPQERRSIPSSSGKGARGLADVPGVSPGKSAQSFGEGGKPSWHLPALEQGWARVLCPEKRKEASWANPPLPSSVTLSCRAEHILFS